MVWIRSGARHVLVNIKAQNSCLNLSGGDNHAIIGYPPHDGLNQQWEFVRQQSGNYLIRSVGTGLYLRIDGEPANDVMIVAGREPYEWYVQYERSLPGSIRLYVPGTKRNIDLSGQGNPNPGAPVTLWDAWPGQHQLWRPQ
ncbi:carbohydrate-binding module family 13 protein [Scleroderma yunnanense]